MRIYSNQPMHEFLQDVRDNTVAGYMGLSAGQRALLLDKLDELAELGDLDSVEERIEAARAEGEKEAENNCQSEIDELRNENDRLAARVAELEGEVDQLDEQIKRLAD